jgi:CheY-like chemotaxis protein
MDIVIVDDEPVSLAVVKQLIARLPECQTHAFSEPSSALSWCEVNEPDLLIVDYVMPEIDGIEFVRRLRHIPGREHTPVVIVTVKGERDVLQRALATGVNDFLRKPFDVLELQSCVSNMLGLRAIHKQLANRALLLDARGRSTAKYGKELGLLDIDVTRARLGGDETLWQEVTHLFKNTVPRVMSTVRAALTDRDLERVLAQVSSLRGAVAVLEAPDVTEFLEKVESHASNGDLASTVASFAMAQTLVERLLRELGTGTSSGRALKTGTLK